MKYYIESGQYPSSFSGSHQSRVLKEKYPTISSALGDIFIHDTVDLPPRIAFSKKLERETVILV